MLKQGLVRLRFAEFEFGHNYWGKFNLPQILLMDQRASMLLPNKSNLMEKDRSLNTSDPQKG